jgi:hypothetical protein
MKDTRRGLSNQLDLSSQESRVALLRCWNRRCFGPRKHHRHLPIRFDSELSERARRDPIYSGMP